MIKSFYLFAFLCVLSLSNVQAQFLPLQEYENEECNWENEELCWEGELEFTWDDASVGKAPGDTTRGNTPEDIGAAVHDAVVKVVTAQADPATVTIPSTGNPQADQVVQAIKDAATSLTDDIAVGADSLGTEAQNVVTNSLNGAQSTGDTTGAVTQSVSDSLKGLGERSDEIGQQVGTAVSGAIEEIKQSDPVAQNGEAVAALDQASGQISTAVTNLVNAGATNADAIGSGVGSSIGDAVNQGGSTADVVANSVANGDQALKDNAAAIADNIANSIGSAMPDDPAAVEQIRQDILTSLESTTPEQIEQDRAEINQAVNQVISTVESQGIDPNQNPGAVIDAWADLMIANGQNGAQ